MSRYTYTEEILVITSQETPVDRRPVINNNYLVINEPAEPAESSKDSLAEDVGKKAAGGVVAGLILAAIFS